MKADDIDILIPGRFLSEQWLVFRAMLERNGYCLIDEHEHTFEKNGIHFSHARLEALESFAGIGVTDIQVLEANYSRFRLLTLEQYLKVYTASSKDCDKDSVKLQEGETISNKWINEAEFRNFVNSDAMIDVHFQRYLPYLSKMGYAK